MTEPSTRRSRIKEITVKVIKDLLTYGFLKAEMVMPTTGHVYTLAVLEKACGTTSLSFPIEILNPANFAHNPANFIGSVANIRMEGDWLAGDVELDMYMVKANPLAKALNGIDLKKLPIYLIGSGSRTGNLISDFKIVRACINPHLAVPKDVTARYIGP